MIKIFCDKCKDVLEATIDVKIEENTLLIECKNCGDAKRFIGNKIKK